MRLRPEVRVEAAGQQVARLGDVAHARAVVALLREQVLGDRDDLLAAGRHQTNSRSSRPAAASGTAAPSVQIGSPFTQVWTMPTLGATSRSVPRGKSWTRCARAGADGVGIERDEVRVEARRDGAPRRHAEHRRRVPGQPPDRLLERDRAAVPPPVAEQPGRVVRVAQLAGVRARVRTGRAAGSGTAAARRSARRRR